MQRAASKAQPQQQQQQQEDARQRILRRCQEQKEMLTEAQTRLQALLKRHPQLALPAAELDMGNLVLMGSGSFACVWATRKVFDWAQQDDAQDTAASQDQDRGLHNSVGFQAVLKVLQLPIPAKQQRHWVLPPLCKLPLADRPLNHMYHHYDELRWNRLFHKEIEAMIACDGHPVIARCLGCCLDDTRLLPTVVMDFGGGANLWHTLFGSSRPRPHAGVLPVQLTWQQATAIYLQLLDAVDWMHFRLPGASTGLVCLHRDISPGNVVLAWPHGYNSLPQVKLVDFGLSELVTSDGPIKQQWTQEGVAVGPDIMFIDPLMWVRRQYGRGTDVFGVAHLMLLMMFGINAAHNYHNPSTSNNRAEEFNAICMNRQALRDLLRTDHVKALTHHRHPLKDCWVTCPTPFLKVLMTQVALSTTAGTEALSQRPTTRQLLAELVPHRSILPPDLAALLPTEGDLTAGSWPPLSVLAKDSKHWL